MLKTDSSSTEQKERGSSHPRSRGSKEKAANRINRIRQNEDGGQGNLSELKAKIVVLVQEAVDELQKIGEKSRQNQPKDPAPEGPLDQNKIQNDSEISSLDIELKRLLLIKRWLEEPPPSVPDQRATVANLEVFVPAWQKILIVDDDLTTVKILTHFLEREKYTVISALSGAEGLEKAFREKPCLILLDIMIPDLNGFQFLSLLRKDKDLSSVPVILLSMLAQESDILKGLEIGAVDYITKPFSPAILLAKIKKQMRQEK